MRYVVTGGSGFTGQYLCHALIERGACPVVFDMVQPPPEIVPHAEFVQGDIRKPEDLLRLHLAKGDVVFHLAARQFHDGVPRRGRDSWFAELNVVGTRNLVEAMSKGGVSRLVFFSTDMTYGRPLMTPIPVDAPQIPCGPYGRSKLEAERILIGARSELGINSTIFRPRLIAGAGRLGILVKLFELIRRNLPLPMIGDGTNRYQMVSVEDCVSAALRAVELDCPLGPFNLGSDDPPTVRELLSNLIGRAGSRSRLLPIPARAIQFALGRLDSFGLTLLYPEQFAIADADYVLDTETTRETLNWSPRERDSDIIFDAYARYIAAMPKNV